MHEEMEQPKKISIKKDSEAPSIESEAPKSELQTDLEKKQAPDTKERPDFKVPTKGMPASKKKEAVLGAPKQADSKDIALVMAEFERISAELKIAAEKAALKRAGEIPPGTVSKRPVARSLNDQPISQDLGKFIDQLCDKTALKNKLKEEAASNALGSDLILKSTPVAKTQKGAEAKRAIPLSTDEQPISFELAAALTKLERSINLKPFEAVEAPITGEVQIGEKTKPRPKLKTQQEEQKPAEATPPETDAGGPAPPLSLQTRPEMTREAPKKIKGGPRIAGKKMPKPEDRDNVELVKGANIKLKLCPKCKTETNEENILCIECGYNFKTGKTQLTPAKKQQIRQKIELSFWCILLIGTLLIWLRPEETRKIYKATLDPYVTPVYKTYIRPYLTGEHDPELQAWRFSRSESKKTNVRTSPKPDLLSVKDAGSIKEQIEEELDAKYPVLAAGDEALFLTRDGKSATARFIGIENGQIVLELKGKQSRGPVDKLTHQTRLRVDPAYRKKHITEQTEQLFKELQ